MVRDYKEEDYLSIRSIDELSFADPEPEWFLREALEKGKAWVFEEDRKIQGFLVGKLKHGLPYIHNVSVKKEFRNKGIAAALFSKFEEHYGAAQKPENSAFWLQVSCNNPAQKLYFDLGYRVGFVDEHYYGQNDHALCMYKNSRPFASR
jgi:ribosomal protein S18 acetylase RimI-like enzyme